jgi:crossover junction endonuclease MUS81
MTTNIIIKIDYRENVLYSSILSFIPNSSQCVQTANLDIGDIEIVGESPSGNIRLIFERKTQNDLIASIKDGRYREQKVRILSQIPAHHCTYIIEGPDLVEINTPNHVWQYPNMSKSVYEGAILNTMYRDKMHIIFTKNTQTTAQWIATLYRKVIANPEKFTDIYTPSQQPQHQSGGESSQPQQPQSNGYLSHVKAKSKKIENIDPTNCYILQLAQVPGVSVKIAQEIAKVYANMRELIHACDECDTPDKKKSLVSSIPMVGPKKADALIQYLQL